MFDFNLRDNSVVRVENKEKPFNSGCKIVCVLGFVICEILFVFLISVYFFSSKLKNNTIIRSEKKDIPFNTGWKILCMLGFVLCIILFFVVF